MHGKPRSQAQRDSAQRLRAGARRLEAVPLKQSGRHCRGGSAVSGCCSLDTCGGLSDSDRERSHGEVCAMLVDRTPDGQLWRHSWHLGEEFFSFSGGIRGSRPQHVMHGSAGRNSHANARYTLQAESIGMDVMSELTDQRDALKRSKAGIRS